jgi:hypothetical protein
MSQEIHPVQQAIRRHFHWKLAVTAVLAAGCGSGDLTDPGPGPEPQPSAGPYFVGRAVFAVDLDNRLLLFGTGSPDTLGRLAPITGVPAGHRIASVDFRPADGQLYGVGTDSRVYTLDTLTAVATPVGSPFVPAATGPHLGIRFEPTTGQLRLHSVESKRNLRLDPESGQVAGEDAQLAFAPGDPWAGENPGVAGTAYTAGGTLYGIEASKDILVALPDPTRGLITTVGALGATATLCAALDITGDGTAYAVLTHSDGSKLFTVDLATGTATLIGTIAINTPVQGVAVLDLTGRPNRSSRPTLSARAGFRAAVVDAPCGDATGQ